MGPRFRRAFQTIDRFVRDDLRVSGVPALVVGVTDRERTIHVSAQGYADIASKAPIRPDMQFEIGSISKSFASLVLLQLQEEGRLDINDPVTKHLPWLKIRSKYKPITLRHLMSHTAGIVMGTDESLSAYSEALAAGRIGASTTPGRFFHYSNSGYKILGLVLEEIIGKGNGEIIKERVTEPLGMKNTETVIRNEMRGRLPIGYAAFLDDRPLPTGGRLAPSPWFESETADGSIVSTVSDMAIYVRMLLNRGRGPSGRIISEKSFGMLTEKVVYAPDEDSLNTKEYYYGLGLGIRPVDGHTYVGHTGGMLGFLSEILADMDDGFGVVTLNNSYVDSNEVALNALSIMRSAVHENLASKMPKARNPFYVKNAEEYVGKYESPDGKCLAFRAQRDAVVLVTDDGTAKLEPRGKDAFLANLPPYHMFLFKFGRKNNRVVEFSHGADWYHKGPCVGARESEHPKAWDSYPGHYRAHNPWCSNFRIVLRRGKLIYIPPAGKEEPVTPLADGTFRVGADKRCPERIEFDAIVQGKAMIAINSGARYARVSSP
jgi:CubicO group peptidase (beta-lactamase class C family)